MGNIFYGLWHQFLSFVPSSWHWLVFLLIFVLLLRVFIGLVKRSLIWLILLIIFVPASLPLMRRVLGAIVLFLQKILL